MDMEAVIAEKIVKKLDPVEVQVEYTSRDSLFFTILKNTFEIHLEYIPKKKHFFYGIYKEDICLEMGTTDLDSAFLRILEKIKAPILGAWH